MLGVPGTNDLILADLGWGEPPCRQSARHLDINDFSVALMSWRLSVPRRTLGMLDASYLFCVPHCLGAREL